mgnify:FL=1
MIPKATITNSTPHQIRNPRYVNLVRTVLTRIIRELNTIIAPRNTTDAKAKKNASSVESIMCERFWVIRKSRDSYILKGRKMVINTTAIIAIMITITACREYVKIDLGIS